MSVWDYLVAWWKPVAIKPFITLKPIPCNTYRPILSTLTNRSAFLTTIAVSEGTQGIGDRGYNCLFGGGIFESYADHPRQVFNVPRLGIKTSAAGRFQVLAHTFDDYKKILDLPDFSPDSQDRIALRLIFERHALDDVDSGNIEIAIKKCSNIWASFQGNNYGQPITPMHILLEVFQNAGGKLQIIA